MVGILLAADHGNGTGGLLRGEPGGGGGARVEWVHDADHHFFLKLDRLPDHDGIRGRVSDSWGERQKQRGGGGGCGDMRSGLWSGLRPRTGRPPDRPTVRSGLCASATPSLRNYTWGWLQPARPTVLWSCVRFEPAI